MTFLSHEKTTTDTGPLKWFCRCHGLCPRWRKASAEVHASVGAAAILARSRPSWAHFSRIPTNFLMPPQPPGVAQVPRPAVSVLLPTPVDREGRHCGLEVRAHPNRRGGPLRPPISRPPARRPIQTHAVNTGIDRPTRPLLIGRLGFQAAPRRLNASPGCQPGDRSPNTPLYLIRGLGPASEDDQVGC